MAFSTQNRKNEMRPLPLRITQLQFDRLDDARKRDGMAMQEHIRRALDLYLDKVEKAAASSQVNIPFADRGFHPDTTIGPNGERLGDLDDRAAVGGPHEGIADAARDLAKERAIRENRPVVRPR